MPSLGISEVNSHKESEFTKVNEDELSRSSRMKNYEEFVVICMSLTDCLQIVLIPIANSFLSASVIMAWSHYYLDFELVAY